MKTVVGLFDDYSQAQRAAQDLQNAGVAQDDISLLANNESGAHGPNVENGTPVAHTSTTHAAIVDAEAGAAIGGVLGALAGASLFVIPGLGWIAGAGWLAGLLSGVSIGAVTGGLIGALTHMGIPHEDAYYYNVGVQQGGTLVAVRAQDTQAQQVADILGDDGAVNIEERAEQYRQQGYVPTQVDTTNTPTYLDTTNTTNTGVVGTMDHEARYAGTAVRNDVVNTEGSIPGVQTGGHAVDGTPDTRGISEKMADAVTGDHIDDKTGKVV